MQLEYELFLYTESPVPSQIARSNLVAHWQIENNKLVCHWLIDDRPTDHPHIPKNRRSRSHLT